MKHALIVILLVFDFLNHVALAQKGTVDSGLLRDIVRGHRLLAQHMECLSGKIECFNTSPNTEKLEDSSGRRFLFFRDKDLLRLEYICPRKGTEIFPGHEKNDITEVVMRSKKHYYQYRAIATTGVPYANLSRSTVLSEAMEITLRSGFYDAINALFALSGFPDATVVNLLQDKIGTVGDRPYKGVPDAVWIESAKTVDQAGNTSSWTVVLNPRQHYALLFHEIRVENHKKGRHLPSMLRSF
jgi:hypothetical protein